ncbi:MAG: glycosyltransferase family 4 protein [Phycisphaerales bacterium]|nr:glycosyltransferase family 4 protein [Phycisphaerales bacterium]
MNYLVAVDYCFVDKPGGMGRVAWDVATAMRDRGHCVSMISARQNSGADLPPVSETDGIRILRYDRPQLLGWHPRRAQRAIDAAAEATRKWLGSETWDVVHIHTPFTGTGVLKALGDGPRYVYTVHSPLVLEQKINWATQGFGGRVKMAFGFGALKRIEGNLLKASHGIQTLSEFTRSQIEHYYGLAHRVTVIPHWRRQDLKRIHTKQEARQQLGWPQDEKMLFTVRRHGKRYGLDVAIQAIGPIAAEGRCLFVVGGDGPLRPTLEAMAREQGCGDRVRFTGRLSDKDLILAYQAADLFILPTVALECFGLITQEAFAFGCPVLSTDACAIPETMRPIMPQFIVPAGDASALRQKVEDYLAGKLKPPPPEALVDYLDQRFHESVVLPKMFELLER